jgi:lipopolysaccharide export system protein LptA
MKKIFLILVLLNTVNFAQQDEEFITVVGDSLIGRMSGGETIREVIGNVVLTQGDVVITCRRAIQFISRNEAELIGNVIVKQDSLTITTERGFYYGDFRRAESTSGVVLNDQKVILTADTGDYYFNEDMAYFRSNVRLYDTATVLTADELTYFRHEDRMVSVGNVRIIDSANVIDADSLDHYRRDRITIANRNVKIRNLTNNVIIYGDHLEDYSEKYYTLINENPLLVQIDTTFIHHNDTTESAINNDSVTIRLDTLIIKSLIMESFRDTLNLFKATDSVQIIRGGFASVNDLTSYFRDDERIITNKISRGARQPVLWNDNTQLTGDSITINLENNRIKLLEVNRGAFINSQGIDYPKRFDQISGDDVLMHFEEDEIRLTEVSGSVYSVYYLYEEEYPNGVNKSSSQTAKIYFEDKKVTEVHLFGAPISEYYPEHQVKGKEESFSLPQFVIYENRPVKEQLFKGLKD